MRVLGIHDGHNATACLIEDGKIRACVQEERLVYRKNAAGFPAESVRWILREVGLTLADVDEVAFATVSSPSVEERTELLRSYERESERIGRLMLTGKCLISQGLQGTSLMRARRAKQQAMRVDPLRQFPGFLDRLRVEFYDHHQCHAATAFWGFARGGDVLVLTADGSGDGLCATVHCGRDGTLERIAATPAGLSIGDIYSRVTFALGFVPLEHEYKLMGMAPYADLKHAKRCRDLFREYLDVDEENLVFRSKVLERTQHILQRFRSDFIRERFDAVSAGLQAFTEEILEDWVAASIHKTGIRNLVAAGGVFMNVKANQRIANLPEVESFQVFPSCGDESLAIGAAYLATNKVPGATIAPLTAIYFGPGVDEEEVAELLALGGSEFDVEIPADIDSSVADLLAKGEVVARCNGRIEFGARALGNRSLLADPSNPDTVRKINMMIKQRDFWMPFAPVLRSRDTDRYLVNPKGIQSPYMMFTFNTRPEVRKHMRAALHSADSSARAQLVAEGQNPGYERILEAFEERTGRAVLLNTSFNLHGDPMVCGPKEALHVLRVSDLRYLALGSYLIHKASGSGELE